VNLTAVTDELMESRMRGYKAGTFTGANKNGDSGWFEQAHEGVLFLDELRFPRYFVFQEVAFMLPVFLPAEQ